MCSPEVAQPEGMKLTLESGPDANTLGLNHQCHSAGAQATVLQSGLNFLFCFFTTQIEQEEVLHQASGLGAALGGRRGCCPVPHSSHQPLLGCQLPAGVGSKVPGSCHLAGQRQPQLHHPLVGGPDRPAPFLPGVSAVKAHLNHGVPTPTHNTNIGRVTVSLLPQNATLYFHPKFRH